ncbi:uncharacterized protein LOC126904732 [Daktulosphaira vitifoliae]|uniref:uncharacterized protein LOC126904732 n=1 Tax=Daktulosphaira vitifoliae TaxID=58002 RepID=UPI0021AA54B4|nr:uncharacterized protein LOC126904732 [Daktulosphaira vitifoliae]
MHLKTILIFCSFSFFNDTMSEGLNIFHIDFFDTLIMYKYGENTTRIKDALLCHGIRETFNNYNLEDDKSVRIFKIFNFLVGVEKTGDEKTIEKLNENDVQIISNIFSNLDTDNDGLINKEKFITLIDSIGYCSSTGNVVTLNENDNENLKSTIVNLKKDINDEKITIYGFSKVLIRVLFYKAQFKNTDFGEGQYLHYTKRTISNLRFPDSINDIKRYYQSKCYDFFSTYK